MKSSTMVNFIRLWLLSILIVSVHSSLNSSLHVQSTKHRNHDKNNISCVVNSWIDKAQNSTKYGDYQTAMKVYQEAIFVNNITHIKLYNHFGTLLVDHIQNYTYGEYILNAALSIGIASNKTHGHIHDIDQLAYVYHNMGVCQMYLGNFNQSKKMLEQSIKLNRSVTVKISYYKLAALFCNHLHDYANAITMLEKILELDSTNIKVCIDISEILVRVNHQFTLERSYQVFNTLIKVVGNDFMMYNEFGAMILIKYNASRDARAIFVKSLSFNVTDSVRSMAFANMATVDKLNGNYTSAVTLLKKAINFNPKHLNWYIGLANLFIQQFANYHEATKFCIDALKIQPNNYQLWNKLNQMLNKNKISFDEVYSSFITIVRIQ